MYLVQMLPSTVQHLALILYVSGANATVNSTVQHLVLILFVSCANATVNSTTLSINTYLSTHTVYQYKIVFSLFWGDMAILENGYRKT